MMSWLQGIRREQSGMIERRANQDRGSQPVAAVGPMHMLEFSRLPRIASMRSHTPREDGGTRLTGRSRRERSGEGLSGRRS